MWFSLGSCLKATCKQANNTENALVEIMVLISLGEKNSVFKGNISVA